MSAGVDVARAERQEGRREGLPRSDRLRRRREFLLVQRSGKRVHTEHFILIVSPRSDSGGGRLGVTITKKVAGAVGRNRVKRVLREVFRRNRHYFPRGYDLVVIAKSGAPLLGYEAVRHEVGRVRRALAKAAARSALPVEASPDASARSGSPPRGPRAPRTERSPAPDRKTRP